LAIVLQSTTFVVRSSVDDFDMLPKTRNISGA